MNAKGKIQAQLSAYLDGELEEAGLRQVEDALESDAELRADLADLTAARKLLRDLPAEKPPADLVARVLAEAERCQLVGAQAPETAPDALRWVRYAASAAVLLVAATVGIVIAFTLCSPEMYKDNLARRNAPDVRRDMRDDKTIVAVAGERPTGGDEDADGRGNRELAMGSRHTELGAGTDGKEGLGTDPADRSGIDGTRRELGGFGRSGKLGYGGGEAPDGTAGRDDNLLAKNNAGDLSRIGGRFSLSGGNTYDGGTTITSGTIVTSGGNTYSGVTAINGSTLAKSGAGKLTLSGGNTYTGGTTMNGGTVVLTQGGALDMGVISGIDPSGDLALGIAGKGGADGGGFGNDTVDSYRGRGLAKNNVNAPSGPFDNVDNMSRVLAGDLGNNTIIYTDRPDLTQRQIETVLNANGIASVTVRQPEAAAPLGKASGQAPQARGNFYVTKTLSPAQVQYEAYVTPEQLVNVQKALESLRAKQTVSQDVPALEYQIASARNGRWKYNNAGNEGWGRSQDDLAKKQYDESSGIALAAVDSDSRFRRQIEIDSERLWAAAPPAPRAARPAAKPGPEPSAAEGTVRPAPEPAPAPPAAETPAKPAAGLAVGPGEAGPAPKPAKDLLATAEAKSAAPPARAAAATAVVPAPPAVPAPKLVDTPKHADPAPVVVAAGRAQSESEEAEKPRQSAPPAAKTAVAAAPAPVTPPAVSAPTAPAGKDATGIARSKEAEEPRQTVLAGAKSDAQPGKAPESPPPAAIAKGPPSAEEVEEKAKSDHRPSEKAEVRLVDARAGQEKLQEQRLAGQVAGPVGGQRADGYFIAPTTPPPTTSPATSSPVVGWGQEQIVQVGVVSNATLAQSGGTVAVRLASPPGWVNWIEQFPFDQDLATANVQKLVITLNYRQAGDAYRILDLDRTANFSESAASQAAPAADKAARHDTQTQSK